jgi:hypothetical protein
MTGELNAILCGPFLSVPTKGGGCYEATWSIGRACRKCDHPTCYRRGMTAAQACADNVELVTPSSKCPNCGAMSRPKPTAGPDIVLTCGCRIRIRWPGDEVM